MASEKQVSANRHNGAKSTGPKTQNGKLQSRRNAMRHGITAATVVTAIEDIEEFERFADMQGRLERLQDRASKRRQIARDVMTELDLKKLTATDFTASIRPGTPSLMVIDEAAVPKIYWEPREPRLNRQELASKLKQGAEIAGVALSDPDPVLSVRVR